MWFKNKRSIIKSDEWGFISNFTFILPSREKNQIMIIIILFYTSTCIIITIIIYRITVVMKVETDIIASIAASLIGRAVILVIMYVTVWPIITSDNVGHSLTYIIQCQSQFIDTDKRKSKKICWHYRYIWL